MDDERPVTPKELARLRTQAEGRSGDIVVDAESVLRLLDDYESALALLERWRKVHGRPTPALCCEGTVDNDTEAFLAPRRRDGAKETP